MNPLRTAPAPRGRAGLAVALLGATLAFAEPGRLAPTADDPLPPAEFSARRAALTARAPGGVFLFDCEAVKPDDMDEIDRNGPRLHYHYLAGPELPGAVLAVMTGGRGSTLFFPPGEEARAGAAREAAGIERTLPAARLEEFLRELPSAVLYVREPKGAFAQRVAAARPDLKIEPAGPAVSSLRAVKSERELRLLRRATVDTVAGLRAAARAVRPGALESEVQGAVEASFPGGRAFPSIVASGPNAVVLHYHQNARRMETGDLVVCDVGAGRGGYGSDVARTFPAGGKFTADQRTAVETVVAAQKLAESALRPGASLRDLDRAVRGFLAEKGCGRMPHALGHHVGLAVHDTIPLDEPFRPGMVVTIEPGIYLKEKNLGVRIEDIYLVTGSGFERWSESLPREPGEIEAMVGR